MIVSRKFSRSRGIKHIVTMMFALALCIYLPAKQIDKEKALVDSIRGAEGARLIELSEKYHKQYLRVNPKQALELNNHALKVARQSGDKDNEAAFLHRIAMCYYQLNQDEKGIKSDMASLNIFRQKANNAGLARCFTSMANAYLRKNDLAKADSYLQQAYSYAQKSKDQKLIIDALDIWAICAGKQNNTRNAIKRFAEAYRLSKISNDSFDMAYFATNLGISYQAIDNYPTSLEYFEISRGLMEQLKDNTSLAKIYNNMGTSHLQMGNYEQSLNCYLKSLELKEQNSSPNDIAMVLVNLGSLYLRLEQYEKAIQHYTKVIELKKISADAIGVASAYSSLGVAYRQLGKYQQSLSCYLEAMKLYKKTSDERRLAQTQNNLGVLYSKLGEIDKALSYYNLALKTHTKNADKSSQASVYLNLSDIYLTKRNNIALAKQYLEQAKNLTVGINQPDLRVKLLQQLSLYHEIVKDYPLALRYYKELGALQDSINANRYSKSLAAQENKYELESKEKQIEILRQNIELNKQIVQKSKLLRNYLMIIIALAMITALVLWWRYLSLRKINRLVMENDAKLQAMNQSLEQRVEQEIEIRRLHEQKAFQQARLASLGELAAGIAHELNQPLHSLAFTLDNMLLYLNSNEADPKYLNSKLDYLFDDISRMRKSIDHIRHFSRQKSDIPDEDFDVNEAVMQTISLIRKQYTKQGVEIITQLEPALPHLFGNPFKLEQVLLNLLSNARDAVTDMDKSRRKVELSTFVAKDNVMIICKDFGKGMNEETREKAFNSFFTTKDMNRGTGLGLTISKGIVEDMGGSIHIESEAEVGTNVSISLPVTWANKTIDARKE